jgi:medium-chain acyl-[acyl-carrier-protein] hydrolase
VEFQRDYFVHYYEADASRRLGLTALVQYLEDVAILDSAAKGMDLSYYHERHMGWMLAKWEIEILALPRFGETVRVSTRVHGMKGFVADRGFTVSAADGATLARARSNWLLVDTERRRPMRVPPEQYERFGVALGEGDFRMIGDVDYAAGEVLGAETATGIRACYGDIDTNDHVNNVRYIAWALDSLDPAYRAARVPSLVRALYKRELSVGAEGEVLTRSGDLESRHLVRSGGEDLFSLEVRWAKA